MINNEDQFDYVDISLPGVGGTLNPGTAMSSDKLEELNKSGKKWRTDKEGNLYYHNEQKLSANKANRDKRRNLVNRERNENADSEMAMNEIMGRRRARIEAFKELKRQEYNFADDSELMSMPQPFAMGECGPGCKGPGKCGCAKCRKIAKMQQEYEECKKGCKGPGKCGCEKCKRKFASIQSFKECGPDCNCAACRYKAKKEQEYREWTTAKREKLKAGKVRGKFAGPDMSFPIASVQDVAAAWSSVGRASNPREVMANIIKIAKEFSWEAGLPKSVRDRLAKGESGLPSPDFGEFSGQKKPKEFAGPGKTFPITNSKDIADAWASLGEAENPKAMMKNLIEIAKRNNWLDGLPKAVAKKVKN